MMMRSMLALVLLPFTFAAQAQSGLVPKPSGIAVPGPVGAGTFIQPAPGSRPPASAAPATPVTSQSGGPAPGGPPSSGAPAPQPPAQPYLKPNPYRSEVETVWAKEKLDSANMAQLAESVKNRALALQESMRRSGVMSANLKCIPAAVRVSPAGNVKSDICVPDDGRSLAGDPERTASMLEQQALSTDAEYAKLKSDMEKLSQMAQAMSNVLATMRQVNVSMIRAIKP